MNPVRRLYEMAADRMISQLIIQDATKAPELFAQSAQVYVNYAEADTHAHRRDAKFCVSTHTLHPQVQGRRAEKLSQVIVFRKEVQ